MTTTTSNRQKRKTKNTIVGTGHSHGMTASAALYYPSLAGTDDELLPSGD